MSSSIEEALQAWRKRHGETVDGPVGDDQRRFSSIPLEPLYGPTPSFQYDEKLGFPGQPPLTRGIQPTMYRGRLWTMRQYAGFADASETNRRFRYLLEQGQTGLSVAFDLPTQIGYDADDPIASGEVGRVGVSICSLDDMALLFEGIPLERVSTSMTINAPAAILLAMVLAVAERQGVPPSALRGTIQNDILKEYVARGTYIFPPQAAMRLITDVFRYCGEHVPHWNPISISGYHMREAGSSAVQEVAFTLANALCYVDTALRAGLDLDEFAPQLTFFFGSHNHFLEEVAKFRAARRLWAHLMRERYGAKDPRSWQLRFHTQTAGSTLTAQQPENNVTRVAMQALAAVLGGTQSLHTNSMDEALALPSEKAAQLALRTQQILAHESGVANTVDPLGGAYAIEALTDEIEARACRYLDRIEELGGALAAIQSGFMQREIEEAAYQTQRAIERGEQSVVGVNAYQSDEPLTLERLRIDPAVEQSQIERLRALRRRRDDSRVEAMLAKLASAAEGPENIMPVLIECVQADLTLGEICQQLRRAWGEYQPLSSF